MAIFVLLSTLTDEGAKTIRHDPGRIREVNAEIERLGVKVLDQWAVLGPYDFVNVVEAADTLAIARLSAELASRGTIRITSMPAIPIEEFIAGLGSSS
ncbi:MAG: GYD domain-containing protein [Thermomicrobiales bacterium]